MSIKSLEIGIRARGDKTQTRATEDHAAKRKAVSSETGSRSGSGTMPPSSMTECISAEPRSFSDPFSSVLSSPYGPDTLTLTLTFNARVDSKSKSSGHCVLESAQYSHAGGEDKWLTMSEAATEMIPPIQMDARFPASIS